MPMDAINSLSTNRSCKSAVNIATFIGTWHIYRYMAHLWVHGTFIGTWHIYGYMAHL